MSHVCMCVCVLCVTVEDSLCHSRGTVVDNSQQQLFPLPPPEAGLAVGGSCMLQSWLLHLSPLGLLAASLLHIVLLSAEPLLKLASAKKQNSPRKLESGKHSD